MALVTSICARLAVFFVLAAVAASAKKEHGRIADSELLAERLLIRRSLDEDEAEQSENITQVADSPPGINPNDRIKLEPKCQESKETGNGTQNLVRFFFDSDNSSCQKFVYTGDGGNENNFPTELDCLEACYIDVHEGEPVAEEDVILIGRSTDSMLAANAICLLPKESGNCSEETQSYYFSPDWQSCLAFKYSGCGGNANRFASRIECEQNCLVADGSVCKGPQGPTPPLTQGTSCADTKCPEGYVCAMGFRQPECCNANQHEAVESAYSSHCLDGSQAGGHFGEYFVATFATSCDDLTCMPNERCQHIESGFAKCCRKEVKGPKTNPHKNDVKQGLPLAE
ncbi:kunitz/Bovine pancreatic trypsin inhibitor domain-containing protein [Ditylenchus destructor]|nr:kunitz/Bovine pancreatic trypsin inhibitor domain-containing protein [Ditylenchus destructor]